MNNTNYSDRLSYAISWLRFPLMFLIIMLHCYSVQRLEGNHETYFKVLYPFALWLGETGVPGFFFISGYLFFMSRKNYRQKIEDRIHTLFIPYILWNLILLFFYLVALLLGHPLSICSKSMAEYGIVDYLRLFWDRGDFAHGNFAPLLCPLWYIRNLLFLSVISPILYIVIKYTRELFLIGIATWWMISNDNAFTQQSILFFSLGSYFSILDKNPLKIVSERKYLFITLACIFAFSDIFVHVAISTHFNLIIHRGALVFNIPALLLLADKAGELSSKRLNSMLSQSAFIVFCVHYPIVLFLRKICLFLFSNSSDIIHILLYFLCIILTTILSLGIYSVLNHHFPKAKLILSGNR